MSDATDQQRRRGLGSLLLLGRPRKEVATAPREPLSAAERARRYRARRRASLKRIWSDMPLDVLHDLFSPDELADPARLDVALRRLLEDVADSMTTTRTRDGW